MREKWYDIFKDYHKLLKIKRQGVMKLERSVLDQPEISKKAGTARSVAASKPAG
jgi:hypothetical protein